MAKSTTPIQLIISEEKEPKVTLKPGTKLDTIAVQLVDPLLNRAAPTAKAVLCGGNGTCVTIVEL